MQHDGDFGVEHAGNAAGKIVTSSEPPLARGEDRFELPSRYESLSRLGKGGGGEVWAVRDRFTGERHALKVLSADATESEMAALVREAVTLSGKRNKSEKKRKKSSK